MSVVIATMGMYGGGTGQTVEVPVPVSLGGGGVMEHLLRTKGS